ncbi:UNVERIFIED_CONTAM: hypothetical protein GTU68_015817 [Idotea baltica]|nr:hypothetical protein [Idotea baltica]
MSKFVVSARKYRPLRFDEVVGQDHVSQTLKNALSTGQIAHAFLFCGPRGIGKTTCARILAKALNCLNRGEDFEPCNSCTSCRSFNDSASFNIIELDGASNNKVENIRSLIDQVRIPPQQGDYKVFIIDEVHMLSSSAFNAFLKTLEEPPPHAIFILATTEKHKLLPTILSRCQIYDFRRIQVPEIIAHLEHICKEENITADQDSLHLIAQKADGALRDALSIFDRVGSFAQGKITYQKTIDNLKELNFEVFFKTVEGLMLGDLPAGLNILDETMNNGFEPIHYMQGLAEHFRNLLMCKDSKTLHLMQVSDQFKDKYQMQADTCPYSFIISSLDLINEMDITYGRAKHKRLHVETCLCKLTYINRRDDITIGSGPSMEKKTLDVNVTTPLIRPIKSPSEAKPADQPLKTEHQPDPNVDRTSTEEHTTEVIADQQSMIVAEPIADKSAPPKPKFTKLSSLFKEVKAAESKVDHTTEFKLEYVQNIWTSYMDRVSSPSLKDALRQADLYIIGDEAIKIQVAGKVMRTMIYKEKELLQQIREHFRKPSLNYEFEIVDEDAIVDEVEKPIHLLTNKEKYELMVSENPLVQTLKNKFDLKVDHNAKSI